MVGLTKNVDSIIGQDGIIGIKTGNTDQAGGCFVFASKTTLGSTPVTVIGAILGDHDLNTVLGDTVNFLNTNSTALAQSTVVNSGQKVGQYQLPWGKTISVVAADNINGFTARNQTIAVSTKLKPMTIRLAKGNVVGVVTVQDGSATITSPAILSTTVARVPIWWRILHP